LTRAKRGRITVFSESLRFRHVSRVLHWAFVIALVAGGLAASTASPVSARKRANAQLVQEFSNNGPITINDGRQSAPSSIAVDGFQTEIADVDVTIRNLTHTRSADVDVLLVGPGGQTALILSDVGTSATNATFVLSDQEANTVPSNAVLRGGNFQPTNFQSGDGFFPPAPVTPATGSRLGVFNSTNPNGVWTLYIFDDNLNNVGALSGGWSLRITTANGVPNASPDAYSANAGKPLNEATGVLTNDSDPDGDLLSAVLAGPPQKGNIELHQDGTFIYRPGKKAKGTDSFTYLAKDQGGLSDLETVTIQIKKAKKKGRK
jgi:subtilisin-like proprotein convertase family protein